MFRRLVLVEGCAADGVAPHPLADTVNGAFGLLCLFRVLAQGIEQRSLPALRWFEAAHAHANEPYRPSSGVGLFQ